jgi:HSP20 family protein
VSNWQQKRSKIRQIVSKKVKLTGKRVPKTAGIPFDNSESYKFTFTNKISNDMNVAKYPTSHPFNSLFTDFFAQPSFGANRSNYVPVNILESEKGFKLEIAAPGLGKEDFSITVDKNVLTVKAKKEQKQEENGPVYRRREFNFTEIERSFRIPESIDTDQVNATFNNGILEIELVKKAALQPVVKTIAIA